MFWMTLTGTLNSHTSAHETFTRLLAVLETLIDQYVPRAKQDDRGNKCLGKPIPHPRSNDVERLHGKSTRV